MLTMPLLLLAYALEGCALGLADYGVYRCAMSAVAVVTAWRLIMSWHRFGRGRRLAAVALLAGLSASLSDEGLMRLMVLAGLALADFRPQVARLALALALLGSAPALLAYTGRIAGEILSALPLASPSGAEIGPSMFAWQPALGGGAYFLLAGLRRPVRLLGLLLCSIAVVLSYYLTGSYEADHQLPVALAWGLIGAVTLAEILRRPRAPNTRSQKTVDEVALKAPLVATLVAMSVSFAIAGEAIARRLEGILCGAPGETRPVTFFNEGGFDWDLPERGKYGAFSSGMFGLLPHYIEAAGGSCRYVGRVDDAVADRHATLVLVNCNRSWSGHELTLLRAFISDGGRLVVLADHTDVFGCMASANSLLDPLGIRLAFDSAYSFYPRWTGCLAPGDNATYGLREPGAFAHAVGCSLSVRPPAFPVVVGAYAFSDHGNRANNLGSLLGNYRRDPGEAFGDIALIAGRALGRGEIIVYGDTSAFQNTALHETFESHVGPLLLSARSALESPWRTQMLLLLVGLIALSRYGRLAPVVGSAWVALSFSAFGSILNSLPAVPIGGPQVALIANSEAPETGFFKVGKNAQGPMYAALARCGYLPVIKALTPDAIEDAAVVVLTASQAANLPQWAGAIGSALRDGAHVICSADGDRANSMNRLLRETGVAFDGPMLSAASRIRDPAGPRFVQVTPVVADGTLSQLLTVHASVSGRPVVASLSVGRGTLTMIGDARFMSSRNTDGSWGFWWGNHRLIEEVLLRGGAPGSFSEPADDPK